MEIICVLLICLCGVFWGFFVWGCFFFVFFGGGGDCIVFLYLVVIFLGFILNILSKSFL